MRVVVIGTGLDGLIAGWVLRQHPHLRVRVIGTAPIGASSEAVGPALSAAHTISMGSLLRALDVPHSSFTPRDGVLLRGKIYRYPHHLRGLPHGTMLRIRHDAAVKARRLIPRLTPGGAGGGSVDFPQRIAGPVYTKERRIRCVLDELIAALTHGADVRRVPEWRATETAVDTSFGRLDYDHLVVTAPLWECRNRLPFHVPCAFAARRLLATCHVSGPHPYARWDSVLTPYTPEGAVHRVYSAGDHYVAEATGSLRREALLGDLNFVFAGGYEIIEVRGDLPGDPAIGTAPGAWPENMTPLGKHTIWNHATALDATLDGAYELMRRLGGQQKNGRPIRKRHTQIQDPVSELPRDGGPGRDPADGVSPHTGNVAGRRVGADLEVRNVRRKVPAFADDPGLQQGHVSLQGQDADLISTDGQREGSGEFSNPGVTRGKTR